MNLNNDLIAENLKIFKMRYNYWESKEIKTIDEEVEAARNFQLLSRFEKNTHEVVKKVNSDFLGFKVINIEKELKELCLNTHNSYKKRNLFYNDLFINCEFIFFINDTEFKIKGITVTNTINEDQVTHENLNFVYYNSFYNDDVTFSGFQLGYEHEEPIYTTSNEENPTKNRLFSDIHQIIDTKIAIFVYNLLDFVEFQKHEYETVTVDYSKEQDDKRVAKGKPAIHSQVYIKLNENIKKYAQTLDSGRGFSHKFLVRGHWRHFNSDWYKTTKGTSTWIKPFIKGEGIFVNKDVLIESQKKEVRQ